MDALEFRAIGVQLMWLAQDDSETIAAKAKERIKENSGGCAQLQVYEGVVRAVGDR